MLDKYYIGTVRRISPEAPVPVVKVETSHFMPGGAGNVANNVVHLRGSCALIGIVGKDDNGAILLDLLRKSAIQPILFETEYQTITKVRVIGEHQQIVRLDFEDVIDDDSHYRNQIISEINKWIDKIDVIVISDYGKGVCSFDITQHVINMAQKEDVCVIVDPKGYDWYKYRGATIIKPNVKEMCYAIDKEIKNDNAEIERYGIEILNEYEIRHLLVTRAEKGMSLISSDGICHFPTEAKEVFDVSGAGDTVIATLAAGIASGKDLKTSVQLANKAAGIVVGKLGTAPIEYEELMCSYQYNNSKLIDVGRLSRLLNDLRLKGKKIIFAEGCFDILHVGLLSYLQVAKQLGDILIVGLYTDEAVKKLKGIDRPINSQEDRAEMLFALELVDYVVLFDDSTRYELLRNIMPDILVKREDYKVEDFIGREFAKSTVVIPLEKYSTTDVISKNGASHI